MGARYVAKADEASPALASLPKDTYFRCLRDKVSRSLQAQFVDWQDNDYPSPTQMWGGDEIFDFGDTCAARSHGFAPEQEQADGLNMGSSLLGVCRDADPSEISPTVRFQPLSLEHRLLVSAVAELDPVPPVRCLRGIRIQRPWARMLLEGVKTVEIRSYPLTSYLNEDLWLIETSGRCRKGDPFKTRIIGIIRFGSHVQYNTATHFEADATAHRQEPRKWLQMAGKKIPTAVYGWRVASVQTLQEPQDPHGQRCHWLQGDLTYRRLRDNVCFAGPRSRVCITMIGYAPAWHGAIVSRADTHASIASYPWFCGARIDYVYLGAPSTRLTAHVRFKHARER